MTRSHRELLVGSSFVLLALSGTSCGTVAAGASQVPTLSPPTTSVVALPSASGSLPVASLTALMQQYIEMFGGSNISGARGVFTNRAAALPLATPGDDVGQDPGVLVYLLQAQGMFSGGDMEPVPAGAAQVAGTQLMVIVNATTMAVSDLGISTASVNIAPLGTPFALAVDK